ILVQPEPGALAVVVDEAGLRQEIDAGKIAPRLDEPNRQARPGCAGFGMRLLIAVAFDIRYPAKRPAIRHTHRERLAGPRHTRMIKRRCRCNGADFGEQCLLPGPVEVVRVVDGSRADLDGVLSHLTTPKSPSQTCKPSGRQAASLPMTSLTKRSTERREAS